MKLEAKVGLFVVFAFLMLLGLSTQLSSVRSLGSEGYTLYAYVKDATGLNVHAKVKLNGVEAGEVQEIALSGGKVALKLFIKSHIQVPSDSKVSLMQESMLGNKMVNIEAGESAQVLMPEASIAKTSSLASFEQTSQKLSDAADAFTKLMDAANNVLDQQRQDELKATIDDLTDAIRDIKEMVADNKELVHEALNRYNELALEFVQTGRNINDWLPGFEQKATNLVDEYTRAGEELTALIGENSEPLNRTLKSTEDFFTTGKDAFVKVDRYLSSVMNSDLHVSIYNHYMFSDSYNKSFASITYVPIPSTYYFVKLVADDDFSKTQADGVTPRLPQLHDEGVYRLTLQYGKRFGDVMIRGGWQESTGGIGLDWFFAQDRLLVSAELFDFNAVNDRRSQTFHTNLAMRYRFYDHLDVYAGLDNYLNSDSFNAYVGFGMSFVDDHLKFLLGSTSVR